MNDAVLAAILYVVARDAGSGTATQAAQTAIRLIESDAHPSYSTPETAAFAQRLAREVCNAEYVRRSAAVSGLLPTDVALYLRSVPISGERGATLREAADLLDPENSVPLD